MQTFSVTVQECHSTTMSIMMVNITFKKWQSKTHNQAHTHHLLHVFRLVVTIHHCKTAFCALWLHSSALSHVGKCLCVFSKIDLFNGTHDEEMATHC